MTGAITTLKTLATLLVIAVVLAACSGSRDNGAEVMVSESTISTTTTTTATSVEPSRPAGGQDVSQGIVDGATSLLLSADDLAALAPDDRGWEPLERVGFEQPGEACETIREPDDVLSLRLPAVRTQTAFGNPDEAVVIQTIYFGESEGDGRWAYWALGNTISRCIEDPDRWIRPWGSEPPWPSSVEHQVESFEIPLPGIGDEALAMGYEISDSWWNRLGAHAVVRVGTTVTLIDLNTPAPGESEPADWSEAVFKGFAGFVQTAADKLTCG